MSRYLLALVCSGALISGVAHAETSASAPLAKALVAGLDRASLDAIAAPDPDEPGRFVAALRIPSGDLLVVSARQPSADAVARRIQDGQFRDVYLDLQATPTPQGKLFVQDAMSDGLFRTVHAGAIDIVYQNGTTTTAFNGDARSQHLSAGDYDRQFAAADQRYAHALGVLTAALQARE